MRARIQKSMLAAICITLVVTFFLISTIFYLESLSSMKLEVQQEAVYVQKALDIAGIQYLETLDEVQVQSRMTLINTSGEVVYDSKKDEYTFENHAQREEVKNALENGSGEAMRTSQTVGKQTYYYALRLQNNMVLRVSKTMDTLLPTIIDLVPCLIGIVLLMVISAYFLAKWQTTRLIAPINAVDPARPLENKVYEELTPLLLRIDEQNKEKEAIANMRKEFSSNVSHELKTPLTSISGYAEIMKSGMVKPEDMLLFSERIYNEASRLIVLIGDIIKLSKLEDENVELEKEWVDLYELTEEICERLALTAEKKDVQFELTGEHVSYFGIRQILDEMIYNICDNAVKYNVHGGTVSIWVGETLQNIKVIVKDTGIGIGSEHLSRIFERFYRADKSHSRETGGTGLGLSIVKHGAIYHHAQIYVESEEGQGTKMELVFEKM